MIKYLGKTRIKNWVVCIGVSLITPSFGQIGLDHKNHGCSYPVYEKHPKPEQKDLLNLPAGVDVTILESNPGAVAVIYLDFDGYTIPTTSAWSNGTSIQCLPSTNTEEQIYEAWQIVAEDFRPFNINVTTLESVFNSVPISKRQRVVITPTKAWYNNSVGGVASPSSFRLNDEPCFSFNQGAVGAGATSSHELGHTLGLSHDGRKSPSEGYYAGHVNYSPIMGGGFLHYEVKESIIK